MRADRRGPGATPSPVISVVVPVYDERDNLRPLLGRLRPVLELTTGGQFEVIFVDDGSRDGSAELLDELCAVEPRYKVIHLSRNFGHQAALQAGLDASRGEAVALMDADLQDPPERLQQMVERWRQGSEVVYGIRRRRKEAAWKRLAYVTFYRTLRLVAEIDTPLDAGDFCLLDRRVVVALASLPERQKYLRGLRSWVGFRQTGVEYEREPRAAGAPKYGLLQLVGLALSGYVGFSALPLRLAAWLGLVAAGSGFLVSLWVVGSRLTQPNVPRGWASTSALILFMGGVQLLVLGVLGEYLGRVYDEVRRRPTYLVSSRHGFAAAEAGDEELVLREPLGRDGRQ